MMHGRTHAIISHVAAGPPWLRMWLARDTTSKMLVGAEFQQTQQLPVPICCQLEEPPGQTGRTQQWRCLKRGNETGGALIYIVR